MELDDNLKEMLEGFVELCEQVVGKAKVVTNGTDVAGIVLDENLAKHICRKTVQISEDKERASKEWVVCSISDAMKYSYRVGWDHAFNEIMESQRKFSEESEPCKPEEVMEENDEPTFEIRGTEKDS